MDQDMQQYLDKAEVLIEALTYIQRFNRKIIVVKCTPGITGSNGSLYSLCPVSATAPILLPWNEFSIAINS